MTRRRDVRKSDFPVVESSQSKDVFDFVRNGQNLSIKQSDLVSALGVTGSLETRGEIAATPVLTIIGSVNYIRNILGGSGINVTLSAQDGVEVSHNLTANSTGVPVMVNTGSDSPTIRSIQAGDGISVAGAGGIIQISSTEVSESSKTVIVFDIDDFPAVSGSVITLEDNTEYKVQADISTAYTFVMGSNTVLSGADRALITLEYTGSSTMITATDVNCKIKDITLSCSSGTMFDVSSTTGLHDFIMQDANGICDSVGTFDNMASMYFLTVNFSTVYTQGLEFSGTIFVLVFNVFSISMPSGTGSGVTLGTAVITYFIADKALININTTGYSISGAASSANIDADGLGVIINSRNFGTAAVSDNILPTDDRWDFKHNANIVDSYDTVLATHGGATITIATLATPVQVTGTWTTQKSSRFTGTTAGTWTYTGIGASVELTASITADIATATDSISFFYYINGVQVADSQVTTSISAGTPKNISLLWEVDLETSDYIQIYVQNDDTNVDVDIVTATMRIRS